MMTSIPRVQQIPLFVFSKVCIKCGIEKPIEAFSKNGHGGLRHDCTQCRAAYNRERQLHPKVKPLPHIASPGYKLCDTCKEEKLLSDFSPHPKGIQGRVSRCKICQAAKMRARRAAQQPVKPLPRPDYRFCKHCDRELPYPQEFVSGGQCKDCRAAYQHARCATPEYREYDKLKHRQHKAYYAAHYLETKEEYQERARKWRKANPEKNREHNLRRKSYKLRTVVETVDYKVILARDGYTCYICGKPIDPTVKSRTSAGLTFDHQVPLQPRPGEPQGAHAEDNIHPAHHACNVRKSNTPFELLTHWQRRGI